MEEGEHSAYYSEEVFAILVNVAAVSIPAFFHTFGVAAAINLLVAGAYLGYLAAGKQRNMEM